MTESHAMDDPATFTADPADENSQGVVPPSAARPARHTPVQVRERIRLCTVENLARAISSPETIDSRLRHLDREWDVERVLELYTAVFGLTGAVLGRFVNRNWIFMSIAATGFLAQHAVQGWCPSLPVLRRMGVRTSREIEQERNALKMLRGETTYMPESVDPRRQAEELLAIQEK